MKAKELRPEIRRTIQRLPRIPFAKNSLLPFARWLYNLGSQTKLRKGVDITLQYISERKAFGQTINKFQVLRHKVAESASGIEAWKSFMYHTSYRYAQGESVIKECSMLKYKTGDLLNQVAYECLQMFGGYGFMEEYPIARIYRDVRVAPIYAGTSEIMKEIISKILIDNVQYKTGVTN